MQLEYNVNMNPVRKLTTMFNNIEYINCNASGFLVENNINLIF